MALNMADCGRATAMRLAELPVIDTVDIIAAGPHWTAADLALFPGKTILRTATVATDYTADVLDIETNALHQFALPIEAPGWLAGHLDATGHVGTLYFWVGNRAKVEAACVDLEFWSWIADAHSGKPFDLDGAVATQWCSYSTLPGQANTPVPGVAFSSVVNSHALVGLRPGVHW